MTNSYDVKSSQKQVSDSLDKTSATPLYKELCNRNFIFFEYIKLNALIIK